MKSVLVLFFFAGQMAFASLPPSSKEIISPASLLLKGRTSFAQGKLKEAVVAFQSIPKDAPEYLMSREELGWTYLRLQDWGALRGLLPHLNSPLVPLEWRLEGHVLSAISDLKSCDYAEVKTDITRFQIELSSFVKKMNVALDEKTKSKKNTAANKLLWSQREARAQEAIKKMRYVRIELLRQLSELQASTGSSPSPTPVLASADPRQDAVVKKYDDFSEKNLVFPGGRDLWSDEIFHMRSVSGSLCQSLWVKK
jgi:hypothetical protein